MTIKQELKHSNNGINYYVIKSEHPSRHYGICAEMQDDKSDIAYANNLFFTETEADRVCKWLADNEVYPVTLCEVLANLYVL